MCGARHGSSEAGGPVARGMLAGLSAKTGQTERAQELVRELGDGSVYGTPLGLVFFHLLSNDLNGAAEWLRKAIEQRVSVLFLYSFFPLVEPLRASTHWPALARMMNLP